MRSEEVLEFLSEVRDPEIPSVDIVGLGIVRAVVFEGDAVVVHITPTYSACPALLQIESQIKEVLSQRGFVHVKVEKVLSPPWSTDWISAEARAAMKASGIAPPSACGSKEKEDRLVSLPTVSQELECPWCGSNDTEIQSEFGSTACKSLCKCHGCSQPFEYFKTI